MAKNFPKLDERHQLKWIHLIATELQGQEAEAGERPEPQEVPPAENSRGGPSLGRRDCPFLEARAIVASSRDQLSLDKEVDSGGHTGAEEA